VKQFLSPYDKLSCVMSSKVTYGSTCFEDFTCNYMLTL